MGARVQDDGAVSSGSVADIDVTLGSNVTSGNSIIAFAGDPQSTFSGSISDDVDGAYTEDHAVDSNQRSCGMCSIHGHTGGSTTVTYTPSASTYPTLAVIEVSGLASSSYIDDIDGGNGYGAGPSGPTTITPSAGRFVAAGIVCYYGVGSWDTGPTGYTEAYVGNAAGNSATWMHYKASSSTSESPTWDWTDDKNWGAIAGAYIDASADAPTGHIEGPLVGSLGGPI